MKLRFIKQFLLGLSILVLGSCVRRKQFTDQDRLKIKIQMARLADVPMPLGIKPILDYIGDNSFGYTLDDQSVDLMSYYCSEMNEYGWSLVGAFEGLEPVLVFEKPHKLLSVVIRKQKAHSLVAILAIDR